MSNLKAIFKKDFAHDRRPKEGVTIYVKAGPKPQAYPRDVIEAAIKSGAAVAVKEKK